MTKQSAKRSTFQKLFGARASSKYRMQKMLALSRTSYWRPFLCRANATLQVSSETTSSVPSLLPTSASSTLQVDPNPVEETSSTENAQTSTSNPTPAKRDRWYGKKFPTKRPPISLENPREWNRPIAEGLLPAFDEALKLIDEDHLALKAEAVELKKKIDESENRNDSEKNISEIDEMKKKLQILEIQSMVNLPSVRWKFANAMADMSQPVYRHLAEKKWRRMGALDLLMERIHQMHVVPDLLPSIRPSFDLRITFADVNRPRTPTLVEPGTFLLPVQTLKPPRLFGTVFHPDARYYTMVLIDPDVPDPENETFTSFLHWLIPNIQLSATTTTKIPIQPHTEYIPPHPQQGTPYHRYTLLFLPHPEPETQIDIPVVPDNERLGFDLRKFCDLYGFDASKGGAAHMWREVWDRTVSNIYKETLQLPEPFYGKPKKPDPYAEVKELKKKFVIV